MVVILVSYLVGQYLYFLDIFNIEWMVYGSEPSCKFELKLKGLKETEESGVYRMRDQVSVRNNSTKLEILKEPISKEPISKEPVSNKPEPNIVSSYNSKNNRCCFCEFR